MAGMALALAAFSAGTSVLSGIQESQAIEQAGKDQAAALNFEAKQMDQRSKMEFAAGQQQAQEAQKKKRLALSQMQNRAAASGFSATDPSNLLLASEIDERGGLQSDLALFEGQIQHDNLVNHANAKRASASNAITGAKLSSSAAFTRGLTSGMGRFAQGLSFSNGTGSDPQKGRLRYG